jgi:hypothetical protein
VGDRHARAHPRPSGPDRSRAVPPRGDRRDRRVRAQRRLRPSALPLVDRGCRPPDRRPALGVARCQPATGTTGGPLVGRLAHRQHDVRRRLPRHRRHGLGASVARRAHARPRVVALP